MAVRLVENYWENQFSTVLPTPESIAGKRKRGDAEDASSTHAMSAHSPTETRDKAFPILRDPASKLGASSRNLGKAYLQLPVARSLLSPESGKRDECRLLGLDTDLFDKISHVN